jgi:hypothetical protein
MPAAGCWLGYIDDHYLAIDHRCSIIKIPTHTYGGS